MSILLQITKDKVLIPFKKAGQGNFEGIVADFKAMVLIPFKKAGQGNKLRRTPSGSQSLNPVQESRAGKPR